MGLIDRLQRVSGIVKNRLSSAVGALRAQAGRLPTPFRVGIRKAVRVSRIFTPAGIALTALSFAPQIRRGLTFGRQAVTRGIAFVGGQRVVTAAGAGGVVGILSGRKEGKPTRPSDSRIISPKQRKIREKRAAPMRRAPAKRKTAKRKRIPTHGHRVISVRAPKKKVSTKKRRTHRSPRHSGHKRVSFTTKTGQKVSFLANPRARHR